MEPISIPVSAKPSVLDLVPDENPTWCTVALRLVIAIVMVCGAVPYAAFLPFRTVP